MPELLPAPPRAIATLAVHSQRAFRWLCLFFVAAAIGSVVLFWPILIKEDFEAYLQCDGPQHGRLHLLKELKQQQVARAESAEGRQLLAPQERSVAKYFVRLIYATSDGSNIFTEKYLNRIREIESRIRRLPSFQHFCYAEHGRCQPPVSVINYFFASVNHATGAMIPDGRGSKMLPIQAILANLGTSNSYFVDRYFGVSQSQLQSALEGNITRSVLRFGLPLRGFTDVQDPEQFESLATS